MCHSSLHADTSASSNQVPVNQDASHLDDHPEPGGQPLAMHALAAAWPCYHGARGLSLAPVKLMSTRDAPGGSQSLALQQHVGNWVGTVCLQ
jgi:hypothetical protein